MKPMSSRFKMAYGLFSRLAWLGFFLAIALVIFGVVRDRYFVPTPDHEFVLFTCWDALIVFILSLVPVLVVIFLNWRAAKIPQFFIHCGEHKGCVFLNTPVLDKLTAEDVADLSDSESEFFEMYQEGWRINHMRVVKPSSQEDLCKFLVTELPSYLYRKSINMEDVMAEVAKEVASLVPNARD